ncbi:AbrB family transcriptional regulator [Enterococcus cecorum]|uniref:AbrB family transcriptional regulator n=1 Tax=Enterococcus cecorum TaxID=44008 RepID=UPI001FABDA05|nr:AbrB family transcriptional regulator [Enterococcus cecorum]MCJ0537632.1 AbrB family transcriptional regulator [Enterococcus cecorum]MCJ0545552.1 AbrB family transcriptional regulator [Enterococcus cecorum]MCJ0549903.1 AbrB family transcriptional regulator [Enterococcus cecorum]MCJ0568931.1 AbrB family transcriptional regulator [Enterococcus cecorum]
MFTKTIKQGNSIMVTVPKSFNILSGVMLDVKKVENGILYTFVQEEYDFFDFSTEILQDIIKEGYSGEQIIQEFTKRKQRLNDKLYQMVDETLATQAWMTKEELAREIGLNS